MKLKKRNWSKKALRRSGGIKNEGTRIAQAVEKVRDSIADKEKKITDKELTDKELLEKHKAAIKKGEEKFVVEEAETKTAMQRGKFKMIQEEWAKKEKAKEEKKLIGEKEALTKKEEQKAQAKEILKKFLEKEGGKKKEILIDEKEQEKLIEETLLAREKEAERLLQESPAYEDLKLAQEETRKELLKPKVLEIVEVKFFEEGELPEKVETDLLTESKRLEAEAKVLAKQCEETEKQMKEKDIDINKMELPFMESLTEWMKFSTRWVFDKKLRSLYRNFETARMAEDSKRSEAQRLRLAATKPEEYKKRMAAEHFEYITKTLAERRAAKFERVREQPKPISWVKRF